MGGYGGSIRTLGKTRVGGWVALIWGLLVHL
jgi:hypothetical protein